MPQLDLRGKIAAAEIAFWVPVFGLSAYLVFRYAFRRDAGWFFLTIFSAGKFLSLRLAYWIWHNSKIALCSQDRRRRSCCRRRDDDEA